MRERKYAPLKRAAKLQPRTSPIKKECYAPVKRVDLSQGGTFLQYGTFMNIRTFFVD